MNTPSTRPLLIEPGVKYFLKETLKHCHEYKEKYYNTLFNISLFVLFLIILGGTLVYKYKGKLTPMEKAQNEKTKQQYILTKIKNYQSDKKRMNMELITGLPQWEPI